MEHTKIEYNILKNHHGSGTSNFYKDIQTNTA